MPSRNTTNRSKFSIQTHSFVSGFISWLDKTLKNNKEKKNLTNNWTTNYVFSFISCESVAVEQRNFEAH
ncbi:CLUMA_CG008139, isoform A [Clunio marinus]|uniref:CLUMA_CG008139, isoform A n=1 Tax=Clunio marinus TaxID=568069 RepID=A0A1J1I2R2_9DIPT|nr:CLUMA_CG008139, isoform A [Clunio marinus]